MGDNDVKTHLIILCLMVATLLASGCASGQDAGVGVADVVGFLADHQPELLPSGCPIPAIRLSEQVDTRHALVEVVATVTPKCPKEGGE